MLSNIDLINKIKIYQKNLDESLITKAYILAKEAHGNQKRHSGEPYFSHPIAVAEIAIDLKLDQSAIITALLHDVVEDTEINIEEIANIFGNDIATLVEGVTKLGKLEHLNANEKFAENFRKLTIAMSKDIRVLLVKLADLLHNMRTLHFMPTKEKRLKKAKESLDIYAPLAARIGLNTIKDELEDLSFAIIESDARRYITNKLNEIREKSQNVIDNIIIELKKIISQENVEFEISGREKKPYSIWQKMQKRNVGFYNLHDIMAFRIIVNNIGECYRVLGIINSNFNMIPGSFKDYISTPKENGYQSLHLVIIGPENKKIEIQIRDKEMHEIAELGVAAHWRYKDRLKSKNLQNILNNENQQYRWIRDLVSLFDKSESPSEVLANHQLHIHSDEVFCFTPAGDIFNLPVGSSLVDFAYYIHSGVGNSCISAKVNGSIAPLRQKIENGDQIEIITAKNGKPSAGWLQFVITSKAKYEIKTFIKQQKFNEYSTLGRAILQKFFSGKNLEINDKILEKIASHFNKKDIAELCFKVADGTINRNQILKIAYPDFIGDGKKNKITKNQDKRNKLKDYDYTVPINGLVNGMAIRYASCCSPIPGDNIIGVINTGSNIAIHNQKCLQLRNNSISNKKTIELSWKDSQDLQNKDYQAKIRLIVANQSGSFADASSVIAKKHVNISNIKTINRSADYIEVIFDIEVKNLENLQQIISALRMSSKVIDVIRE